MEKINKIGDIYDRKTTSNYYETVGRNFEEKLENDEDKLLNNLIPQNLEGKIVLDLGCGNGRHSEIFCKRGAEKVVAIDLSESMLEEAKARKEEKGLSRLELAQADMDDLPVGKDKFDFIFSRFSLMYSGNMKQVVKTLSESLSDNGKLLAEVSIASKQEHRAGDRKKPVPLILTIGDKKVELKNFPYSMEEYTEAFKEAGLEIEVAKQFPADNLTIKEGFPDKDKIKFSYAVFQARKDKRKKI